jgi:hypothetical protein
LRVGAAVFVVAGVQNGFAAAVSHAHGSVS